MTDRAVDRFELTRSHSRRKWERHIACSDRARPFVLVEEATLQAVKLGANVTIFLLFFGISLLDAVRSHDWLRASLWLALGLVFLRADSLKPRA